MPPHSWFTMEFFCHTSYPELMYIRSEQGYAEIVRARTSTYRASMEN